MNIQHFHASTQNMPLLGWGCVKTVGVITLHFSSNSAYTPTACPKQEIYDLLNIINRNHLDVYYKQSKRKLNIQHG